MSTRSRSFFSIRYLNNSYPVLHGFRFFAMVMMILSHTMRPVGHSFPNMSMDMFFVLSGFLIAKIIFAQLDSSPETSIKDVMNRFYLRRAIRTIPIYYFCIFFYLYVSAMPFKPPTWTWWRDFFFLNNYSTHRDSLMGWAWSLSAEEHFYLLAPLICFFVMRVLKTHRSRAWFFFVSIASFMALHAHLYPGYLKLLNNKADRDQSFAGLHLLTATTHVRMPELLMGMALGYYVHYCHAHFRRIFVDRRLWRRVTAVIGYGAASLFFFGFQFPGFRGAYRYVGDIWGIPLVLILIHLLSSKDWLVRFLSRRVFLGLATVSYSAFLIHSYFKQEADWFGFGSRSDVHATLIRVPMVLTLTFATAYVMHLFIEKPCLAFRDRYFPDLSRQRAAPSPVLDVGVAEQNLVLKKSF